MAHGGSRGAILAALAGNCAIAVTKFTAVLSTAVTIDFHDDLPGGAVKQAAAELTRRVEAAHPEMTRIFLRPRP
jgi:hypothetical protein